MTRKDPKARREIATLRERYAGEYAAFGLTVEDLQEFTTAGEMESFAREVQLEYYKQSAERLAESVDEYKSLG